jgi:very-short-patch-repair endonuclease
VVVTSNSAPPKSILNAIGYANWVAETNWEYFSEQVESPIERLLLAEIIAAMIGRTSVTGLSVLGRDYVHGEERFFTGHGIICYPQGQVGKYRADFVFDVLLPFNERTIYVVECDGHDFHDRTKEQAQSDRQRDRFMLARGIKVLRYTGAEIYRDAETVWREIVDIITDGHGGLWGHPQAKQRSEAA